MPSAVQYWLWQQSRPGRKANGRPATYRAADPLSEKVATLERVHAYFNRSMFLPWLDRTNIHNASAETLETVFRAMKDHYVVKPALLQKLFSVGSLDLQATPASESPADEAVAEFVRYQFAEVLTVPDMVMEVLYPAQIFRQSVCELVWSPEPWPRGRWRGKRFFKAMKAKAAARPVYDDFGNVTAVEGPDVEGETQTWDPEGFVVFRNLPLFGDDGTSDFLAAYQPLYEMETIKTFQNVHLDKYVSPFLDIRYGMDGAPTTVVDPDTGGAVPVQEILESHVPNIRARGYLIGPPGVVAESRQLAVSGPEQFQAAISDREQKIVLAIAGAFLQTLTAPGGSGDMRGDSATQASTAQLFVWYLATAFCSALNRQAVPLLVRENFGPAADYPTLSLGGVNLTEQNALADLYTKAVNIGAGPSRKAFFKAVGIQAGDGADQMQAPGVVPPGTLGNPLVTRAFAEDGLKKKVEERLEDAAARPGSEVGVGGADGRRAEALLEAAKAEGRARLESLARAAVARLLDDPEGADELFTEGERALLAAAIAATTAPAELLGRTRIRVRAKSGLYSGEPTPWGHFDERDRVLEPMAPKAAVEYFRGLVPGAPVDPDEFEEAHVRRAFELAATTDERLLDRVKQAILERMEEGGGRALVGRAEGREVGYLPNPKAPPGYVAVLVDPAKLDEGWAKDRGYYIPPGGGGGEIAGRREEFERFLATGKEVEAPVLVVDEDGTASFEDGRHRFSVLRDRGADQVAVMVPEGQAARVRDRYGSDVPPERSKLTGPQSVERLLDAAEVGPTSAGYAETVFRTNMMEAYHAGAQKELDEVADAFPVWRYSNPDDGRSRPHHAARNGKYYPSGVPFSKVRGEDISDIAQCRCDFLPVHRSEWAELKAAGAKAERV